MAIEKGAFGRVLVETNLIGEMISYTLTETVGSEDTAVAGADEARPRGTRFSSSGQVVCYVDDADVGQGSLAAGALVDLEMQPEGQGTGKPQRKVTQALVTELSEPLETEEYNKVTFSWEGGKVDRTAQT